jgi:hypothetical protein
VKDNELYINLLTPVYNTYTMPSGGPEFRGDVKYKNALVEYKRRRRRLVEYRRELKTTYNQNHVRFLEQKIARLKRMV